MWTYVVSYHQKCYCSFQQAQAANFDVSTSTVFEKKVICPLTGLNVTYLSVSFMSQFVSYSKKSILFAISNGKQILFTEFVNILI